MLPGSLLRYVLSFNNQYLYIYIYIYIEYYINYMLFLYHLHRAAGRNEILISPAMGPL